MIVEILLHEKERLAIYCPDRIPIVSEEISMMRKKLWVVLAGISIFATGCTSQKEVENTLPPTTQQEEERSENIPETETPNPNGEKPPVTKDPLPEEQEEKSESYQIKKTLYQSGNLTIEYPQLTNMTDKIKEQQMNELLKKEAMKFVTQYEDSDSSLSMNYQVTVKTKDTLSVFYTGNYNAGMYPTHLLFTTNINLQSGEKLRLSDVASIDEAFIDKLKQSPYIDRDQPSSPNKELEAAVRESLANFKRDELIEALEQADQPTMEANPYGVYSYFEKDYLIVSIQVPHALGDHAEFRLNVY